MNTGIQMRVSESEASGLLYDFKWLEFAEISERLFGPIICFRGMGGAKSLDIQGVS
jgi:hypothetical protein